MSTDMKFNTFQLRILNYFNNLYAETKYLNKIIKACSENTVLKGFLNNDFKDKLQNIENFIRFSLKTLKREKMKCSFFGSTSNGKSALINAILGKKVLPSGVGRTTSCFITIEGCEERRGYFIIDGLRHDDISKLTAMANEINTTHMPIDSHIQLFWPTKDCHILKQKVRFLDSPGVDYSSENDEYIDTYCRDSDIFVYVVDATRTINEYARNFFSKVKKLMKNPKILVVMNQWDRCDTEENENTITEIKDQHDKAVREFLCVDLCINGDDLVKYTFFLSAKEQLEDGGGSYNDERVKKRREEFERFYKTLCQEMSINATRTKFVPIIDRGKQHLDTIIDILQKLRVMKESASCVTQINKDEMMDKMKESVSCVTETSKYEMMDKMKESGSCVTQINKDEMMDKMKESGSCVTHINKDEMMDKIDGYIKNVFIDIQNEGEKETVKLSSEIFDNFSNNDGNVSLLTMRIFNNIRDGMTTTLSDIVDSKNESLDTKLSELLSNYSQFQLSEDVLKHYITGKEKGIKALFHDFCSKLSDLKNFDASAVKYKICRDIADKFIKFVTGTNRSTERKEQLISDIQNVLMEGLISDLEKSENNVKLSMKKVISRFCVDHSEACKVTTNIDNLKVAADKIWKDLNSTMYEIMNDNC